MIEVVDGRLFKCARCHKPVIICSDCDRGNIYCNFACARIRRKESQKKAQKKYQGTLRGRKKHALRQKRYRRNKTKVTHHGSEVIKFNSQFPRHDVEPVSAIKIEAHCCHFCGKICSRYVRIGFLRRKSTTSKVLLL